MGSSEWLPEELKAMVRTQQVPRCEHTCSGCHLKRTACHRKCYKNAGHAGEHYCRSHCPFLTAQEAGIEDVSDVESTSDSSVGSPTDVEGYEDFAPFPHEPGPWGTGPKMPRDCCQVLMSTCVRLKLRKSLLFLVRKKMS